MRTLFLASILFFVSVIALKGRYFINKSPSLPIGIWKKSGGSVAPGTYVIFCPTKIQVYPGYASGGCVDGLSPMLKKVKSKTGEKLFVIGSHPRSHDSRSFGEIDQNQIITTVRPLFVWR